MLVKKFLIFLLIIILHITTILGQFSINSIDNLAYVVALGFDLKESGKLELSFQIAIPNGENNSGSSSQSSSSIINSIECNSIESGINLVNSYLSKKVNLSHCKAVVFSEEISKKGIGEYLYTLINHVEMRPTCNIIVSRCNAKYFLNNSKPILEQFSSRYYELAFISEKTTGYTANITLQDFFSNLTDSFGEAYAILGSVNSGGENNDDTSISTGNDNTYKAAETPIESQKNIETLGLAVFKGDKLVGELSGVETIAQLILTNKFKNATLSIPSPFESTNIIDLYINKSKCTTDVYISNGTPYIKPNIKLEARIISMSDDYKNLSENNISIIETYAKNYFESYMYNYLNKTAKEFKSDIPRFW